MSRISRPERMRQDNIKNSKPDERGTITGIKGLDFKHAPKPEQYDFGEEKEFHAWRDLFFALLSAHDEQWDVILGEVENMGRRVINEAELKEIQSKLAMESDVMNMCTKFLFTTLLQYTKRRRQSEGYVPWDERSDGVVRVHCFIRVATQ